MGKDEIEKVHTNAWKANWDAMDVDIAYHIWQVTVLAAPTNPLRGANGVVTHLLTDLGKS